VGQHTASAPESGSTTEVQAQPKHTQHPNFQSSPVQSCLTLGLAVEPTLLLSQTEHPTDNRQYGAQRAHLQSQLSVASVLSLTSQHTIKAHDQAPPTPHSAVLLDLAVKL
jgi:hypothetical protein